MLIWRYLLAVGLLVGFSGAGSGHALAQDQVAGRAIAIAGDTVRITRDDGEGRIVIRLRGVDAPEPRQHCETEYGRLVNCGVIAMDTLSGMLRRKQVTCVDLERDGNKHLTGLCYAGDVILNGAIIRVGWALAYIDESQDYIGIEKLAKRDGKGLWKLRFEKPWIWRAEQERLRKKK